jgi:hypothetical protein
MRSAVVAAWIGSAGMAPGFAADLGPPVPTLQRQPSVAASHRVSRQSPFATRENIMMRRLLALVLLAATSSADAAPLLGAGPLGPAAEAATPLQTVACARYGWRGWGIYPGCFRQPYGPAYVVAEPYYAPAPVYVAPPVYVRPPRSCWIAGAWRPC